MLKDHGVVEGFWKSLKYEEAYLRAYDCTAEAKHFIGRYAEFYNADRPHSALGRRRSTIV